jgi:hypothetical protein
LEVILTVPEQEKDKYLNLHSDRGDDQLIDQEVVESFAQDQLLDHGSELAKRRMQQHTDQSPELVAGDADSTWDDADAEEAGTGATPTPDENLVDELGGEIGISYSDSEPLHTEDKFEQRDRDRWELNPASDPEYRERIKEEFHEPQAAPNARYGKRDTGGNRLRKL